uniref:NADH dehydrogenase [ubiquinone] 1 beta subcomplex subunit 11, mitochondrial n=1 Tax=Cacopsylla melanoneura TaxID=428564 RepID=A0A8D8PLG8_9HEMI
MAGLIGLRLLSKVSKTSYCLQTRAIPSISRWISTSNKKSDVSATASADTSIEACEVKHEKRHWQSYGFDSKDELNDLNVMHSHGFFFISIGLCVSIFILAYRPDIHLHDWAEREAFLELRRREKLGLPLIDPNYVDPATIVLPTDEELGDTPIII